MQNEDLLERWIATSRCQRLIGSLCDVRDVRNFQLGQQISFQITYLIDLKQHLMKVIEKENFIFV